MYPYKKKSHTVRLCDLGAHACNAPLFGPLRPIHRWRIVLFRNLLTTQCQCGGTPSCWMVKHQTSQQYIPYSGRRNHQFSTHSTSELFGTTNKALSNTLHIFVRNMRTACWFPFAQITCIFELFVPTSNTLSSRRFNTVLSMKFMLHCCNRFNTSKHHTQKKSFLLHQRKLMRAQEEMCFSKWSPSYMTSKLDDSFWNTLYMEEKPYQRNK